MLLNFTQVLEILQYLKKIGHSPIFELINSFYLLHHVVL